MTNSKLIDHYRLVLDTRKVAVLGSQTHSASQKEAVHSHTHGLLLSPEFVDSKIGQLLRLFRTPALVSGTPYDAAH